jgi:GT2 family glycosyltransferase
METRFTSHERKSPYRLNTVRNNGISLATGQLIFLVDGDILVPRNFLYEHENIHKLLSYQHKKALVSCMRMNITPEGSVVPTGVSEWCRRRDQYLSSRQWHQMDLKPEYTVSQSTFLKSDWDKVGGFDGDFDGYWGFDEIEFAFRLKKSGVLLTSHGIVHHIDEGPGAGNRNCDRNALLYKKKKEEWARRQQKQN